MVIRGADWFVSASIWIARKVSVPEVLVGATLVSLGTTLPELSISAYSSYRGFGAVAYGNAVGSCIANIGLIMGGTVALKSLPIKDTLFFRNAILMIGATAVLVVFSANGSLERWNGVALLAMMLAYYLYLARLTKLSSAEPWPDEHTEPPKGRLSRSLDSVLGKSLQFVAGAAAIAVGSRFIVTSATSLAEILGIPERAIALTLIALGTSLPELATALTALSKGHQALSAGNIMGANFLNITAVLGVASTIGPVPTGQKAMSIDYPFMLILMVGLLVFATTSRRLSRYEGVALLSIYLLYIVIVFLTGPGPGL